MDEARFWDWFIAEYGVDEYIRVRYIEAVAALTRQLPLGKDGRSRTPCEVRTAS